jgi:hypothetical protein
VAVPIGTRERGHSQNYLRPSSVLQLARGDPATDGAKEKSSCPADIPLDFAAKASIAVGVDGLLFGRSPAWPEAPGLWWLGGGIPRLSAQPDSAHLKAVSSQV